MNRVPELAPAIASDRKLYTRPLMPVARASKPRPGVAAVRMPGDTAHGRRRAQLASGVELYPSIMPALKTWAEKFGIAAPAAR